MIIEKLRLKVQGAWRFRWHAAVAGWTLALIGTVVVLMMPEYYEARARVLVNTQSDLEPLLEGISAGESTAGRLSFVQQALKGQQRLAKVADRISAEGKTGTDAAALVSSMRRDITIGPDKPAPGAFEPPKDVYVVTYKGLQRELSLNVVETMLKTFMEDSVGGTRTGFQEAENFLDTQMKDYTQRLSQSEQALADFKRKNIGVIPGEQGGDYIARLQTEMEALRKTQSDLSMAQGRRDELQRQMRGGPSASGQPSIGGAPVPLGATAQLIDESEAKLSELLLRYTDQHPDVITLRSTIAELKRRQDDEIKSFRRGDVSGVTASGLSKNPIYQNMQIALSQSEVEVASLRREHSARAARVAELRSLLDRAPQVEGEYARLTRDYETNRSQYQAINDRIEKIRVSQQATETGVVKFEILDPPSVSASPAPPTRRQLILLVLVASLSAGAALAYLLHVMQPVTATVDELHRFTGFPILGAVSLAMTPGNIQRRRHAVLVYACGWIALAVTLLVVFIAEPSLSGLIHGASA